MPTIIQFVAAKKIHRAGTIVGATGTRVVPRVILYYARKQVVTANLNLLKL